MKTKLDEPLLDKEDQEGKGGYAFGLTGEFKFEEVFINTYNDSNRLSEEKYLKYCKDSRTLAGMFRTNLTSGLDQDNEGDLKWREELWGNNKNPPPKPNSIFTHIIECLSDQTLIILMIASAISLTIGVIKEGLATGWMEGASIFMAVFIVTSISSYMNWKQVEEFNELDQKNKIKEVIVIRKGQELKVTNEDVLVGDLVKIKYGNIAVVDGIIVSGKLTMDESPVTGESEPVKKEPEFNFLNGKYTTPFVFSGSQCKEGEGIVLTVAVGNHTFSGKNEELRRAKSEEDEGDGEDIDQTPLQRHLAVLANQIGDFGFIMAIIIGICMIAKEVTAQVSIGAPLFTDQTVNVFINAFIIAVVVIVVAIPEGLPMAVTISLTYSVGKMKDENNLVKDIKKSETMGTVNNICTDKTGTLTKGIMEVVSFYIQGNDCNVSEKRNMNLLQDLKVKETIQNCIYKNISAKQTYDREKKENVVVGDMTECSLFNYLASNGYDVNSEKNPAYTLPFNSEYKYMISIYKNEQGSGYTLYIKGAPENAGAFCTKFLTAGSKVVEFSQELVDQFKKIQESYADRAIRTLTFGYKELTQQDINTAKKNHQDEDLLFFNELAQNCTFAFMVGIRDNYRPEVPDAIKKCEIAGITVRMVTGDNIATALAISKDVGIITADQIEIAKKNNEEIKKMVKDVSEDNVQQFFNIMAEKKDVFALEGEVFRKISGNLTKSRNEKNELIVKLKNQSMFKETVKNLKIIARASPEDKFLLVHGLKALKNIVAVTGDGTNDAPALTNSHVGFAMGIRGTDIAKAAADIILLDDSFSSIVTACKYGRNVYDCIRKFVQFQLVVNIVAVFMTFLGGIILKDAPMNAIQMLWVNLIMDSFASLALATESPNEEVLKRKPISKDASIISNMMVMNIACQSIFQIITLTVIIFYGDLIFGVPSDRELEHFMWDGIHGYHFTIFFNIFVYMQILNSINCRKTKQDEYNVFSGIFGNWLYLFINAIEFGGQILIVTFGGRGIRTQRLSVMQHVVCFGIASISILIGLLIKFIPIDVSEKVDYGEDQEAPKEQNVKRSFGCSSKGKRGGGIF